MKTIDMVVDLQYGSTGKGLLAGWLAKRYHYDTIMTAWAPNAGHTFIDDDGTKYVHTMLANGVVGDSVRRVLMGPGSIINLTKLWEEVRACQLIQHNKISIFIHAHAAVVTDDDIEAERESMTAIGSTKKGVGAAAISKIRRQPLRPTVIKDFANHPIFKDEDIVIVPADGWLQLVEEKANNVLIEGAQGYGLSIHHGFYPYTTSRDVTPAQILADCGVPFHYGRRARVLGTCRTFPIRVSNRYDDKGSMVGWSGPVYPDQQEIPWGGIGLEAELTTVTKLPRRLFTWSNLQIREAVGMCDAGTVFLNFVNYLVNIDDHETFNYIRESLTAAGVTRILYGIGPTVRDVIECDLVGREELWGTLCDLVSARKVTA